MSNIHEQFSEHNGTSTGNKKNMKERKEPLLCARNPYCDELYDYRNTYFGRAACSADLPYSANSSMNGLTVWADVFSIGIDFAAYNDI